MLHMNIMKALKCGAFIKSLLVLFMFPYAKETNQCGVLACKHCTICKTAPLCVCVCVNSMVGLFAFRAVTRAHATDIKYY